MNDERRTDRKDGASAGITKVAEALRYRPSPERDHVPEEGQRVSLVNFGTFTVARRKARLGRNPRPVRRCGFPQPEFRSSRREILKSAVR